MVQGLLCWQQAGSRLQRESHGKASQAFVLFLCFRFLGTWARPKCKKLGPQPAQQEMSSQTLCWPGGQVGRGDNEMVFVVVLKYSQVGNE